MDTMYNNVNNSVITDRIGFHSVLILLLINEKIMVKSIQNLIAMDGISFSKSFIFVLKMRSRKAKQKPVRSILSLNPFGLLIFFSSKTTFAESKHRTSSSIARLSKLASQRFVNNFNDKVTTKFITYYKHSGSVRPNVSVFVSKRIFLTVVWPSVHKYPVKTITEKASFQKLSPLWRF